MNTISTYRNNRFNLSMHSLEWKLEGVDASKASFVSDQGAGVERMLDQLDYDRASAVKAERLEDERRVSALDAAKIALASRGYAYLIETLDLIVKNKNNRAESFKKIPKSTYMRHLKLLLEFFGEN